MDHGSGVYGSVRGKPDNKEEKEMEDNDDKNEEEEEMEDNNDNKK